MKDEAVVWYYVDGAGKRNGPCSQQKLLSLRFVGKISQSTLVWSAGMAGWVPFSEKFSVAVPPPVPEEAIPKSIEKSEIDDDVINYLFTFKGRANRSDYWLVIIIASLLYVIGYGLAIFWWLNVYFPDHPDVRGPMLRVVGDGAKTIAYVIVTLLIAWPSWVVVIKRWHDIDRSGWWSLIILIPIVGWLMAFVANGFIAGTKGPNRFGEEKK